MCSTTITWTHGETKTRLSTGEILSSVSLTQLLKENKIIEVEHIVSTVRKPNCSHWENVQVWPSHCWGNIKVSGLSWQFFCLCIAEAN